MIAAYEWIDPLYPKSHIYYKCLYKSKTQTVSINLACATIFILMQSLRIGRFLMDIRVGYTAQNALSSVSHPFNKIVTKIMYFLKEKYLPLCPLQYLPDCQWIESNHKCLFILCLILLLGTHFNNLNKFIFPLAINYISFFFVLKKKCITVLAKYLKKKKKWQ